MEWRREIKMGEKTTLGCIHEGVTLRDGRTHPAGARERCGAHLRTAWQGHFVLASLVQVRLQHP